MADTLEEALLLASSNEDTPIRERYKFEISNDLRTISIPSDLVFGVYFDRNVQTIDFEMPRYYHDLDLAPFGIKINYVSNNEGHIYIVDDKVVGEDTITFTWTVDFPAYSANGGTVTFSVCLRQTNNSNEVIKELNTTIHTVKILPGLEVEIDESDEDTVKDYLVQISNIASDVNSKRNEVIYNTNLSYIYKESANDSANSSKAYSVESKNYRDESKNYRDQAAAIVTPDGLAARVLALEDLGFFVDSEGYIVQEADD